MIVSVRLGRWVVGVNVFLLCVYIVQRLASLTWLALRSSLNAPQAASLPSVFLPPLLLGAFFPLQPTSAFPFPSLSNTGPSTWVVIQRVLVCRGGVCLGG